MAPRWVLVSPHVRERHVVPVSVEHVRGGRVAVIVDHVPANLDAAGKNLRILVVAVGAGDPVAIGIRASAIRIRLAVAVVVDTVKNTARAQHR